MADVKPDNIPFILTSLQPVVREDGRPTQAWQDWVQSLWGWMKQSVVDLTTKVTTLEFTAGDLQAQITTEATIRETDDGILASQIDTVEASSATNAASIVTETNARIAADTAIASAVTTVEATANSARTGANNATASGAVYLAAKAAPSGASAAYGWHIAAGSSYAGMEAIALSGGGSAIGFTASAMYFTDSGTAQQVLTYNGSAFVFGVPIVLRSGTSGARQEITNENTRIYDASNVLRVAIGVNI
ncbi:hypothetical protein [Bosea sp. BK604]|uniref:hypothetical protein n=1 Tax=Bosea sp. BK604 TaxID=2512180 RepID=UPI0010522173|nr:hypothetical protein [Bosea sp. BK604]TCR65441.1 hypothetical protein EV560_105204 [Bosea sp. BK604]